MSLWAVFEQESVPNIQDNFSSLCLSLRKKFCMHYSEQINAQLRKYFRRVKWATLDKEVVDVSDEFYKISKLIFLAY